MSKQEIRAEYTADNKDFKRKTDEVQKKSEGFGKMMKKVGGMVAGVFAFHKIFQGFKKIIGLTAEFDQALANLSAITGATGRDLEFYGEQARQIGKITTISAAEAVKAFELMGSARPELLKNKEALAAVTKEAVVLAEAAGLELPTATEALARAMNQFNVPASEAGRVINVLAAGSKEGAEAIPGLADGILAMGTAANLAGTSLEETVGMLETLAEKGIAGAESGTQLRNVILLLQKGASQFNPKVVGMKTALDNLANANLSAAEMVQMFGLRNMQAASILVSNREKFAKYTEAVTGTNVAYEQQEKRVDTLQGAWKVFVNTLSSAFTAGSKFNDFLKRLVQGMTRAAEGLGKVKKPIVDVINYFIDLYNESTAVRVAVEGIKFSIRSVFDFIKMTVKNIVEVFVGLGQVIRDVFTGNWGDIKTHAKEAFAAIKDNALEFTEDISENWDKLKKNMEERPKIKLIETSEVKAVESAAVAVEEYAEGIERVISAFDKLNSRGISIAPEIDTKALYTGLAHTAEAYTAAQQAAMAFSDAVVSSSFQGVKSVKDFARASVDVAKKVISAYLAEAVASQVKIWAGTGPLGLIAAGVAAGATVALFNSLVPSFAAGGAVSGPSLAVVGEAPGISASNPEYIGTAAQLAQMGVGGSGRLTCRVSRGDLLFILNEGATGNQRKF